MTQVEKTEALISHASACDGCGIDYCHEMESHARDLARKLDLVMALLRAENAHPYKKGQLGHADASRTPMIADIYEKAIAIVEGE